MTVFSNTRGKNREFSDRSVVSSVVLTVDSEFKRVRIKICFRVAQFGHFHHHTLESGRYVWVGTFGKDSVKSSRTTDMKPSKPHSVILVKNH